MLDWMSSIFDSFAGSLKNVLPTSPFSQFIKQFGDLPYLGWVNWFVPIGPALNILTVWLAAIAVFYIYSIALRWLKAIGD